MSYVGGFRAEAGLGVYDIAERTPFQGAKIMHMALNVEDDAFSKEGLLKRLLGKQDPELASKLLAKYKEGTDLLAYLIGANTAQERTEAREADSGCAYRAKLLCFDPALNTYNSGSQRLGKQELVPTSFGIFVADPNKAVLEQQEKWNDERTVYSINNISGSMLYFVTFFGINRKPVERPTIIESVMDWLRPNRRIA